MTCKDTPIKPLKKGNTDWYIIASFLLFIVFMVGAWVYIFYVEKVALNAVFSDKNLNFAKRFFTRLVYDGKNTPAYLDGPSIINVIKLMLETLHMSIIAIVFSTIGMFMTLAPIMMSVIGQRVSYFQRGVAKIIKGLVHITYLISRAVPELIWAMILIFIFRPGILPGALALGIHNFGILGKLCLEVVENMDMSPLQSVIQSGAGRKQTLVYAVLPIVKDKFISYIIYRWEIILRTTIVVGMVGAGGLGQHFKLHLSWFHYTDVTLILLAYLLLVFLSDKLSENLRKQD